MIAVPNSNINNLGLDDALNNFVKKIQAKTCDLTVAEKTQISTAGARVFRDALESETRAKHYSNHADQTFGHAADNIEISRDQNGKRTIDTDFSGGVRVGWNNRYHAMNMLRANDGTMCQIGDHFVTNLRANANVRESILDAERKAYEDIVSRKGGDD